MSQLILIRHGESQWNLENRFTGWVDVGLTPKGEAQAKDAGRRIRGRHVHLLFTSVLKRAIRTAEIACQEAGLKNLPTERDQALNERHYGDLQGLNKDEARKKWGEEQVHLWRRSYDIQPPGGESLKDTLIRVEPYFKTKIRPALEKGQDVLVVAHGNSLRALIMMLEKLTPEAILKVELGTGVPIIYDLGPDLKIKSKQVLDG
jgi:2,3-bisphosphoglycerate-dependent phosphoglycerate mutase